MRIPTPKDRGAAIRIALHFAAGVALLCLSGLGAGCANSNSAESTYDLSGFWSIQSAASPEDSIGERTIELPAVVADFIEDPAGAWQLLCRPLPARFVKRIRAGEGIVWHTGHVSDVSRFFVNDTPVGGIGSLPPQYAGGHMRARLIQIPHAALHASPEENRLCMALWSAGGFRAAVRAPGPLLGTTDAVYAATYRDRILTQMMLGIYSIIGLYHLFLFIRGRKNLYDLYFAGLCISVTAYFFLAAPTFREFLAGPLAVFRLKLEFAILTVLAPLALLFIEQLLRGRHPPFVGALLACMALPWPLLAFGEVSTIHYSLLAIHAVMLGTLLYLIYRILREALNKNRDARLLLIGTLGFVAAVLHDVLLSHLIVDTPPIASIAFAVLLPAFAAILANRVIRIQEQIRDLNRNLEERVVERTADLEQARIRAEEASRAKSRFLAAMSHEIRTPLQAMLGASDLLVATDSQADRKNLARMLDQAGENLSTLIEDTLDLARIEADRIELKRKVFNLHELIRGTASILKIQADAKDLALQVSIDAAVPEWVHGDPGRLSQILLNLAGNAVKFTDTGEIRIRAQGGDAVRIDVEDTGPGIAPEDQTRIFEAFEQAPDFISRSQTGAGLGLAISARLAKLMHGEISVNSTPGRGSLFRLSIQLEPAGSTASLTDSRSGDSSQDSPQAGATATKQRRKGRPSVRILIAEDNADIRQLLRIYVQSKDWQVDFAENGREALQAIKDIESDIKPKFNSVSGNESGARSQSAGYDLVILDMQMPVLDGERTARILRRWERRSGRAPGTILAFTAHAMFQEREEILAAGCDALIAKPIVKNDFLKAVEKALTDVSLFDELK